MLFSDKIPFHVAVRLTPGFWIPYLLPFATIRHYSRLFAIISTIRDYSNYSYYSLFAIRYSGLFRCSLFAIRYSLFAIRYSRFAIRYSLFGFSRHPFRKILRNVFFASLLVLLNSGSAWFLSKTFTRLYICFKKYSVSTTSCVLTCYADRFPRERKE